MSEFAEYLRLPKAHGANQVLQNQSERCKAGLNTRLMQGQLATDPLVQARTAKLSGAACEKKSQLLGLSINYANRLCVSWSSNQRLRSNPPP